MFKDKNIIQAIQNKNYVDAIEKVRALFKETFKCEDIIQSFIIGILGVKGKNLFEYMLQLSKFNSYGSNETNQYLFLMNDTMISIITEMNKDNKIILTVLKYYFKEKNKTFHMLYMIYLIIGISNCDNYEITSILKRTIKKEKCKNCFICNNIEHILNNNVKTLKERATEIIKPKISIRNNCTSARLFLSQCYIVNKVKQNKKVFTYQDYIKNTIPKNKSILEDVDKTFDISKYSTDTVNIVSSFIGNEEEDDNELTELIENHMNNISKGIMLLNKTFDDFEQYNKCMKEQIKSIIDKYSYK